MPNHINLLQLSVLRKARKMTRRELADKVGISVNYIYKIENGLKTPTLVTLHKIALALNVKPSTIVDLPLGDLKAEMLETLRKLKLRKEALSRELN
jgi:transcriptional regulator with XRE-family HTH domain